MVPIPFDKGEMVPMLEQPSFGGDMPSRTIWTSPLTPRMNALMALAEKQCMFMPNTLDFVSMNTPLIADNRARATVMDGGDPYIPNPEGEPDAFGVMWLYDPVLNGSMVRPGAPLFDDASEWRDVLTFPDPDSWDWEAQAEKSREYLSNPLFVYQSTIFTGLFERLISFMDFENAAVALIDEDQKPYVHELFDALCDLYTKYIDHFVHDFGVNVIEVHDDWGSQRSPFMKEETLREMILPYISRLADHMHRNGAFFKLHSCGKIENFVPLMAEAGIDIWMGQPLNDKKPLVQELGDKIMIEVEAPELGVNATDEEVWEAARQFVDDYVIPGKPACLSIYSATQANRPLLTQAIYELSRQKLCG